MAKTSNSDLLTGILMELDQVLTLQKAQLKAVSGQAQSGGAAGSAMAGALSKVDKKAAGSVSNVSGAIGSLGIAMQSMKKVSTKEAKKAADCINILAKAVNDLKLDKGTIIAFERLMNSIGMMNSMFAAGGKNIFLLLKTYTWPRGFALGKIMGRFYKGILAGLKSSGFLKSMSKNLMGKVKKGKKSLTDDVVALIQVLVQADSEKLQALTKILKKFPKNGGAKFGEFLMGVLNPIVYMKNKKIKEADIKTFRSLIRSLNSLNIMTVMGVWLASKLLKPAAAKSLGKFFSTLVKTINKIGRKQVNAAANIMRSIGLLFLCLALTLLIVVSMAVLFKPADIGKGFLILFGLIAMSLLVIGALMLIQLGGKKSPARQGIKGAKELAVMFLALALALTICILIGSLFKWSSIAKGFVIMIGVIAIEFAIMLFLGSEKFKKSARKAYAGLGAMVIIILVTILAAFIFMKMGPYAKDILKAGGVSLLLVAGFSALIWALSKLKMKLLAKGMIAAVAVVGLIWLTSKAMKAYLSLMNLLKNLTWAQLGKGSAMVAAVIGGFGVLIAALAAILMIPGAKAFMAIGAAAVAIIGGIIWEVSKAVQQYVIAVKMASSVTPQQLKNAANAITSKDGMIGFVKACAGAFTSIAPKVKGITEGAKAMLPMFDAVSRFIDIIQKMATLLILDHFDNKGKPVFRKMKMSEFSEAATHLSTGFSTFISELLKPFEEKSDNIWKLDYICSVLGTGKFKHLLKNINYFVTTIQKMASQAIADKWDKNGNPIHYLKFTNKDFLEAATTLAVAFGRFLSELVKPFEDKSDNIKNLNKIVKTLGRGGKFMNMLVAINYFIDIVKKMASSQMAVEWDKNGKAIKFQKISTKEFLRAAIVLATAFSIFVATLALKIDKDMAKHIKMLGKYLGKNGSLLSIIMAVNAALVPMSRLASGYFLIDGKQVKVTGEQIKEAARNLSLSLVNFLTPLSRLADKVSRNQITKMLRLITASIDLVKNIVTIAGQVKKANDIDKNFMSHAMSLGLGMVWLLKPVKLLDGMSRKATKKFNDSMEDLVAGYNQIVNILPDTVTRMLTVSMAQRTADNEIVKKTDERVTAIKKNVKAYTAITKSILKLTIAQKNLNKEMREWNRMTTNYNWLNKWKEMMDTQIKQLTEAAAKYNEGATAIAEELKKREDLINYDSITAAIQAAKWGFSVTYEGNHINGVTAI